MQINFCRAKNHCSAKAGWEGAQNSKPEDLPVTVTAFAFG